MTRDGPSAGDAEAADLRPADLRPEERPLSTLLEDVVDRAPAGRRVSVGDLLHAFGNRAFGALIFIFAAPNMLPIGVPGLSAILGAPLLFLTWQLACGRARPWLPEIIRHRSFASADFARLVERVVPWLRRLEHFGRHRLSGLTEPAAERAIGIVAFVLSLVLFLPIPLGNMAPGFALSLLALGVLKRDGVAVLLGVLAGIGSLLLVSGVVYGLAKAAIFIARNALGA